MTITVLLCMLNIAWRSNWKEQWLSLHPTKQWRLRCSKVCWVLPGKNNWTESRLSLFPTIRRRSRCSYVCWILSGEKAGESKGFHFFHQHDGNYDALLCVEYCLRNTDRKSKGFHLFQQRWRLRCSSVCWILPEKKQLEKKGPFTSSNNMMTITMLLCLWNIAWKDRLKE